jgi:cell shape-determining protein MreD
MLLSLFKKAIVYIFITVIVVTSHLPLYNFFEVVHPNLLLLIVFFYELNEERLSKIFLIFIGLMNDYIESSLIGITSLELIALSILITKNYKALEEQKFGITWAGFAIIISMLYILKLIILSIFYHTFMLNTKLVFELALTIAFYPLAHFILLKVIYMFGKHDNAR